MGDYSSGSQQHTEINVLQESEIKGGADREVLVLWEDDVTAVITVFDGLQDVLRIIFTIAVGFDGTSLRSVWRLWEWFAKVMRLDRMMRPIRPGLNHIGLKRR